MSLEGVDDFFEFSFEPVKTTLSVIKSFKKKQQNAIFLIRIKQLQIIEQRYKKYNLTCSKSQFFSIYLISLP